MAAADVIFPLLPLCPALQCVQPAVHPQSTWPPPCAIVRALSAGAGPISTYISSEVGFGAFPACSAALSLYSYLRSVELH